MTPKNKRFTRTGTLCFFFCAVGLSCGLSDGGTESQTHWLAHCATAADCGEGLACVCGQCTLGCSGDDDCQDLDPRAACSVTATDTGNGACDAPACVLPCIANADCTVEEQTLACDAGSCRPLAAGGSLGSGGTPGSSGEPSSAGTSSSGASSSGASSSGASGGKAVRPGSEAGAGSQASDDCEPQDAREIGLGCMPFVGFAWDGTTCSPIDCCTGTECDTLPQSAEDCDRAFVHCHAERGITRNCVEHSDCRLVSRGCCEPCGDVQTGQLIALRVDSLTPADIEICECEACSFSNRPVTAYPFCVEGQCGAIDIRGGAECSVDQECRVKTKDCCECNGTTDPGGLVAESVNAVGSHLWCPDPEDCPQCAASYPEEATAHCDGRFCVLDDPR